MVKKVSSKMDPCPRASTFWFLFATLLLSTTATVRSQPLQIGPPSMPEVDLGYAVYQPTTFNVSLVGTSVPDTRCI